MKGDDEGRITPLHKISERSPDCEVKVQIDGIIYGWVGWIQRDGSTKLTRRGWSQAPKLDAERGE